MQINKFRLFKNSNIYKNIFTFFSLISVLVLSIFILLSINSFPLSKYAFIKTSNKTSLLFIVWYSGFIINKNLHISKHGDFASYFFAIFLNTFLISMIVYRWDYSPKTFFDYYENFYYFLGLLSFHTFWTFILYFVERKTRPYFSKYLFWNFIFSLMLIIIFLNFELSIQKYIFKKETYNYLETYNLLIILFMPVIFIVCFFSLIKGQSCISKYAIEEKMVLREIIIWNSFIRIASLAVWIIWSIGIDINSFKMYDKIFIGITGFCFFVCLTITTLSIIKKNNRFLIYTLTTNLIIMSVSGFVFVNILKSIPSNTFLLFVLFVVLFQSVFILFKPTLYKFYAQLNSIFTYMLMIFILIVWTGNDILGEIKLFNINEIIWGILVFISVFMLILYAIVELYISSKISFKFSKLIRRQKRINKKNNKNKKIERIWNG